MCKKDPENNTFNTHVKELHLVLSLLLLYLLFTTFLTEFMYMSKIVQSFCLFSMFIECLSCGGFMGEERVMRMVPYPQRASIGEEISTLQGNDTPAQMNF